MKLYAESILIGTDWQRDKTIEWDATGTILAIEDGWGEGAEKAQGPLIPGMVNCHSHAFQRAFAGLSEYRANDNDSFWSWRDIMYRFVSALNPDDVGRIAQFLYMEMLKAGYTCVAEFHYLHHQATGDAYENPAEMSIQVINAAVEAGIAITHLPVLYRWAGFGKKAPSDGQRRFIHTTDAFMALVEKLEQTWQSIPLVKIGCAPHSLRAVSDSDLRRLLSDMQSLDKNAPIHIHIAEQTAEVDDCVAFYGARPVEWLADQVGLKQNMCLIHATHLTEQERRLLASSEAIAGICPTTEANLGDGIFPLSEFLQEAGGFAIGSDSHISVNVAEELRLIEYTQRLTKRQRAVLADEDCTSVGTNLYARAVRGGAQSVNQSVGGIAVGQRADLVTLDTRHPSLMARDGERLLDSAIFAAPQMPVRDVWVAGRKVVEAGRHPKEESIIEAYQQTLQRILS